MTSSPNSHDAPEAGKVTTVLQARDVTAGYGSEPVIHNVSLEVRPGEIVALLGANGAGKTTTLLALSGELPTMAGEIRLHDEPTSAPLFRRAREGLAFVTEERSVFMGLTTRQNLKIADVPMDRAMALFPELEKRIDVKGGELSGGEQQMLSVARALCREPKVLLADELSLGLAPLIVKRLLEAVRSAADNQGTGVLLVEQHVQQALRFADRAFVLQRGRIVLEGTSADMLDRIDEIEANYLASGVQDESDQAPNVQKEGE
jgi:branched-chain amino acid transport system ATP-binding protein